MNGGDPPVLKTESGVWKVCNGEAPGKLRIELAVDAEKARTKDGDHSFHNNDDPNLPCVSR